MCQVIPTLFLLFGFYFTSILTLKSGPFITTLISVQKCNTTKRPWDPDPSGKVMAELYYLNKKKLVRGNYTAIRRDPSLKMSIQEYLQVNGQWELIFHIRKLSCRSNLIATFGKIFNVQFNQKTCVVPKGLYKFSNLDFDTIDHISTSSREYGNVRRRFEVANKKDNLVICMELDSVVTPKKDK